MAENGAPSGRPPNRHSGGRLRIGVLVGCAVLLAALLLPAQVAVKHTEGMVHGFLALGTLDGRIIASGDLAQTTRGDRVTTHVVFQFKDGSLQDETAVYSQSGSFRLLSDHLVQKGPAFKRAMDVSIDGATGEVAVRYTDDDGKEKAITERLKLPADVSNGMTLTVLKNIQPDATQTTLAMVVATPKPRLVKLVITPHGEDSFSAGGSAHKATHYVVKVEIGGIAGAVAPLVGKQPADTHVWILGGEAPAFVKSEGPLYDGGPIWRIELTSPVWAQAHADSAKD
jgi:hypothetical protein